ncbi:hypothetical protein HKX48_004208 [Thoreauomyces humboldtii]|nr:hypothetical protein HKX48_004208 [Thoreauomyces humboldtii]
MTVTHIGELARIPHIVVTETQSSFWFPVLFKFKDSVPATDVATVEKDVWELKSVPTVLKMSFGPTFTTHKAQGFTHTMVFEFANKEDLQTYLGSPTHCEFVQKFSGYVPENGLLIMDIEM